MTAERSAGGNKERNLSKKHAENGKISLAKQGMMMI